MAQSETQVIKTFFGQNRGIEKTQTALEFMAELKTLSTEEKHDIAVGGAKSLGLKAEECGFVLDGQYA